MYYQEFYDNCKYFGQALIALGIGKNKAVNIIGFNSPEWTISFFGSIFGFVINHFNFLVYACRSLYN